MDSRIVADADYNNPASEDRDEADRDNYDPDSDPDDDRDDGFGVAAAVAVVVGIAIRVRVRVAVVAAVFVVVPIVVLSAADDTYSLYPSLYISFAIGIGIVRRAVTSNRRRRIRRTCRHVTAVFVVVLDYRPNRMETALYSDDDVSSLEIGVNVDVGVGNAACVRRGRRPRR